MSAQLLTVADGGDVAALGQIKLISASRVLAQDTHAARVGRARSAGILRQGTQDVVGIRIKEMRRRAGIALHRRQNEPVIAQGRYLHVLVLCYDHTGIGRYHAHAETLPAVGGQLKVKGNNGCFKHGYIIVNSSIDGALLGLV